MSRESDDTFVAKLVVNQNRVYRYVMTIVPNHADVEELVQQTLLVAWEKRAQYRDGESFAAWACGIALNHIRNFRRKASGRVLLSEEVMRQLGELYVRDAERLDERRDALADCVGELSREQQGLLAEFYDGTVGVAQIAARLNRSSNAIYKTIHRLRAILYDCVNRKLGYEGAS